MSVVFELFSPEGCTKTPLCDGEDAKKICRLARCIAQCEVCKVYFSAQPNNLKLILNEKYYPIEHIFVPACSSARKEHFFKF